MSRTVHASGIDMAVDERGMGEPLLFVHGFPLDATMWERQLDYFAGTHRVIAPDLRGFGKSGVTPGEITMERYADDLADLLDALGIRQKVVLCGLSMGGYIAFAFWHRHRARLKALVLADTRATPDTPQAAGDRRAMADRVAREGPGPVVEQMAPKLVGSATVQGNPKLIERLRAMMLAAPAEGVAAAARGLARRQDWTSKLSEIDLPTLVVAGSEDAITPAEGMRELAAALPDARYVEIPGVGHMSPTEDPATFNAALADFLKSC